MSISRSVLKSWKMTLEDDEGDSAVDDIVTFVDDIEDSGGLARS